MSKMELLCEMNQIDAMLDASRSILGLLAGELSPEHESVINGVVMHLHNSQVLLDKLEERFGSEGVTI